jgi:hypothetical protein
MYLILLFSLNIYAGEPIHWSHLLELSDRHEFYQNHEAIIKPKDSWQTLFGLVYIDRNIQRLKDCVFYRVPGLELGNLKIKTIPAVEKCEDYLLKDGDKEIHDIKSLEFSALNNELKIDLSFADFRSEKWEAHFQTAFTRPVPAMHLSSAELKSPKIILLAPAVDTKMTSNQNFPQDGSLCHDINEDCEEVKPSSCHDCQNGWYEIPNGCRQGPKYCGQHYCGGKDQPACRRGMVWQKKEINFECRMDSSFAYCSKGLKIFCDGKKAYCR